MLSDMIPEALHSEYEDTRGFALLFPGPRAASSLYTRYARARHEYIGYARHETARTAAPRGDTICPHENGVATARYDARGSAQRRCREGLVLLFPCPRAASTFLRSARRDYGTRRHAALRGCDTIYAQDDACPATRTTYPYPHDAASRIIIATCLVIPCLHPHLHSSIPTRHGTQFHLHLRLAFGGTWFLVSVLGFGFGRLGSIFPCHAMLPSPCTTFNPAGAWLSATPGTPTNVYSL